MGSINNLSSSYLQSVLGASTQATGTSTGNTVNSLSSPGSPSDTGQLSPFAQLLASLQHLQQTDPTRYQQVTGQIATNLQSAAQTAQVDGNSSLANQLNQLAADFSNASTTGQAVNIQNPPTAGGHHHHHHHGSSGGSSSSSDTQNDPLDPLSIIESTLSGAGITAQQ